MAIVDSPLLSLGAKKTLGKTLTFSRLKGQNVVRQRVIPANPQTLGQTTQRGFMRAAVKEWHELGLLDIDLAALNRWATASFRKLSGYNLFVREYVDYQVDLGTEKPPYGVTQSAIGDTSFYTSVQFAAGGSCDIFIGTSKTSQPTKVAMEDEGGGMYDKVVPGLAASTTYYYYIRCADGLGKMIRTGLYTVTTTA